MTWNWKWDSLILKPKLLIMHPTRKEERKLMKEKLEWPQIKDIPMFSKAVRKRDRKRTQEFLIPYLPASSLQTRPYVAGRVVSCLLPPLAEWKDIAPTMTNTQDRNILQKALWWEPLSTSHCAGKMFQMDHLQAWRGERFLSHEVYATSEKKGTVDRKIKGHCVVW